MRSTECLLIIIKITNAQVSFRYQNTGNRRPQALILTCLFSDSLYKNWWEPPDEIIKIKPSDENAKQRRVDDSKSVKAETVSVASQLLIFWSFALKRTVTGLYCCVRKQQNCQHVPFNIVRLQSS